MRFNVNIGPVFRPTMVPGVRCGDHASFPGYHPWKVAPSLRNLIGIHNAQDLAVPSTCMTFIFQITVKNKNNGVLIKLRIISGSSYINQRKNTCINKYTGKIVCIVTMTLPYWEVNCIMYTSSVSWLNNTLSLLMYTEEMRKKWIERHGRISTCPYPLWAWTQCGTREVSPDHVTIISCCDDPVILISHKTYWSMRCALSGRGFVTWSVRRYIYDSKTHEETASDGK
jgi:hypothetical protein